MPLPSNFATTTRENKEFTPLKEGIYDAVVEDIDYKGMQETQWGPKEQIVFIFLLPELDRKIWQTVVNTWSPQGKYKASQYFTICTSLGINKSPNPPTAEEVNGLIGRPIKLIVKQVTREDGTIKNKITEFVSAVNESTEKLVEEVGENVK